MGLSERENMRKKSIVESMLSGSTDSTEMQVTEQDINIVPKIKAETRSKRVNLLVTPSVYRDAQKKCKRMGISLNECINQFLANWVQM